MEFSRLTILVLGGHSYLVPFVLTCFNKPVDFDDKTASIKLACICHCSLYVINTQ